MGQHQIAPSGITDARGWDKARFAPFYPSTGTHLCRSGWMAAGVRYFCSLASCLHNREILGCEALCTNRTEHSSWVLSPSALQQHQPFQQTCSTAAAFGTNYGSFLCQVFPAVRQQTAGTPLYLLSLKNFLLQWFKTWQEAGAVYLPRGIMQRSILALLLPICTPALPKAGRQLSFHTSFQYPESCWLS